MYMPSPLDTSNIRLKNITQNILEKLAENTHNVWAENKIKEGWTFGPIKDDKLKVTPCLVPYESLPEREKEYDRKIVLETLKLYENIKKDICKE